MTSMIIFVMHSFLDYFHDYFNDLNEAFDDCFHAEF